jgi:hypothetical protein
MKKFLVSGRTQIKTALVPLLFNYGAESYLPPPQSLRQSRFILPGGQGRFAWKSHRVQSGTRS